MINQYDKEKGVIHKAAGQFSVYLRRSSLILYNDAKLAYLDHLIEEEGKVQVSGSRRGLHGTLSNRKQHSGCSQWMRNIWSCEIESFISDAGLFKHFHFDLSWQCD